MDEFSRWKAAALAKADLSKKGSIDSAIEDIVHFINNQPEYFTTSSCSGRIVICSDGPTNEEGVNTDNKPQFNNKKGCIWYLVSHTAVDSNEAIQALKDIRGSSKLKFEPFVLHVQCESIEAAKHLHQVAVAAGFRNSGISIGKGGKKIISAVRGTACLEVPFTDTECNRLTNDEYIEHVVQLANGKLEHNFKMIDLFEKKLKLSVAEKAESNICTRTNNSVPKPEVYRRKRKSDKQPKEENCSNGEDFIDVDSNFLYEGS